MIPSNWPLRRQPLPGEIFSSWLLRNIRLYGDTAYSFCKAVWPKLELWSRDADRHVSDAVVRELAGHTRTPWELASATTLRPELDQLSPGWRRNGVVPWLLPIGVFHRTRTRRGLQYCPACLDQDADPYLRRTWRFALSIACLAHGCGLRDGCPHCDAPVVPHRSRSLRILFCFACHGDLRVRSAAADDSQIKAQGDIGAVLSDGGRVLNGTFVPAGEFFGGARLLFLGLGGQSGGRRIATSCLPDKEPPCAPEQMRIERRAEWLPKVLALMEDWPTVLLSRAASSGGTYRSVVPNRCTAPAWMEGGLDQLPRIAWGSPTERRKKPTRLPKISWRSAFGRGVAHDGLASFVSHRVDSLMPMRTP